MSCFLRKILKICIRGHRTLLLFKVFCPLEQKQGWLFLRLENKSEIFRLDRSDVELLQGVTYFSIIRSLVKRKLQYYLELHGKNVGKEKKSWNVKKVAFVSN